MTNVQARRPPRRTRAEARAETRRRILEAGLAVFLEVGYARASVEEIAARAGYTGGAFYSNFANKEELFFALMDARFEERVSEVTAIVVGAGPETLLEELRAWTTRARDDDGAARLSLFMEFRALALRDEPARRRLAVRERAVRQAFARAIDAQLTLAGVVPPAPVEFLALIVQTLDSFLPLQHALDPEAVPEDAFYDAIGLLFRAAVALGAR